MGSCTFNELLDRRKAFNDAAGRINNNSSIAEMRNAMEELEAFLGTFKSRGRFDDPNRRVPLYSNQDTESADQEDAREEIAATRFAIAAKGLELLQYTVPTLQAIATDALALAGKEAVRAVCSPTTSDSGQPIPSKYQVPEEYQSIGASVVSKVKAAISR